MINQKSSWKLWFYGILSFVMLLGLLFVTQNFHRYFLLLEIAGLVILAAVIVIGFIGYARAWGERVLFFAFLLYLANLAVVWYFTGEMYFVLLVLAVLGFFISVPKNFSLSSSSPKVKEELHSVVFDPVQKEEKPEEKPAVKFTPGKFVASKNSNSYHLPKCEWAKKIAKSRRVWFVSEQEAEEKGFKKHSCLK